MRREPRIWATSGSGCGCLHNSNILCINRKHQRSWRGWQRLHQPANTANTIACIRLGGYIIGSPIRNPNARDMENSYIQPCFLCNFLDRFLILVHGHWSCWSSGYRMWSRRASEWCKNGVEDAGIRLIRHKVTATTTARMNTSTCTTNSRLVQIDRFPNSIIETNDVGLRVHNALVDALTSTTVPPGLVNALINICSSVRCFSRAPRQGT